MNQVTEIVAFIADGEDSLVSMQLGDQHFPMVTARQHPGLIAQMEIVAKELAKVTGKTIRKVRFIGPEVLETFEP